VGLLHPKKETMPFSQFQCDTQNNGVLSSETGNVKANPDRSAVTNHWPLVSDL